MLRTRYSSQSIENSTVYDFVCAMFDDGFEASEVVEICEEHEVDRLTAVLTVHYYCIKHKRPDSFLIEDTTAIQLIQHKSLDWL